MNLQCVQLLFNKIKSHYFHNCVYHLLIWYNFKILIMTVFLEIRPENTINKHL